MITIHTLPRDADGRIAQAAYDMVAPWWTARGTAAPLREILPGMGVLVMDGEIPVAVSFMYLDATGSGLAWLAWPATLPGCRPRLATYALKTAEDFLTGEARRLAYWIVFTTTHHHGMLTLLEAQGYQPTARDMVQLCKPLV